MTYQISSESSTDTEDLGSSLGRKLRGGEVLVLSSDLGGGKTTFVRGLARGMGSTDHVASPTFTISRQYSAGELTIYHLDFYRLPEAGVVKAELEEFIHDPQAVVVIEWSAIVDDVLPADKITILMTRTGEESRDITITFPPSRQYVIPEVAA